MLALLTCCGDAVYDQRSEKLQGKVVLQEKGMGENPIALLKIS